MASNNTSILRSIIFPEGKSFLIGNNSEQVSIEDIEGKIVGIYFSSNKYKSSREFTEKLKRFYKVLKDREESFDIVSIICHEDSKESFTKTAESLPWLVVPFEDERGEKLAVHLRFCSFPALTIVGKDGEITVWNACDLIEDHGIDAYPFSSEKLAELKEIERAWIDAHTLESLLVDGELDFVTGKDDIKVPVSELVGKTILLYFSSHGHRKCLKFNPKLIKVYNKIKERGIAFEIILISCDGDQSTFRESYLKMPWLALSFGDKRIDSLCCKLKVRHFPTIVALGANGRAITNKAMDLILAFGSHAYPFTDEHVKETVEGWPKRLNLELHPEHELEQILQYNYWCDVCNDDGPTWSFSCEICGFDLDPMCALGIYDVEDHNSRSGDKSSRLKCNIGQECYAI